MNPSDDDIESNTTGSSEHVHAADFVSEPEMMAEGQEKGLQVRGCGDDDQEIAPTTTAPPSSLAFSGGAATTPTTAAAATAISSQQKQQQQLPQNLIKITQTKAPKEALKAVYAAGKYKAGLTLDVLMTQSFMAGLYIAMAGNLYLSVGGGVLGAALFPTGLMAVLLTSAELFTGDALIFIASLLGGRVSVRNLCRNWTVSWICNFVGCVFWAAFMTYFSNQLEDAGQVDLAVKVAMKKAYQPWYAIFLKGIGANVMVCLGVWQYTCAEEVAGKVLALWFPIAGFVMMGFDHCIANQYLIPLGMMYGADISVVRLLFQALLPATLGNLVGGGVFIGAIYWYVFDSMETSTVMRERIHSGWERAVHSSRRSSLRFSSLAAPTLSRMRTRRSSASRQPPPEHEV